jgi:hypothetical protein
VLLPPIVRPDNPTLDPAGMDMLTPLSTRGGSCLYRMHRSLHSITPA